MASTIPKFVLNLLETKYQIPFQRPNVLPIHSENKKNTPLASPKGGETFPYMMIRGVSSENKKSHTLKKTPSEHRYKKLLFTMADQQDLKTSESSTLGDYTGLTAKRIETSPQMLTPSSTRKTIVNLRKSNFSVAENKVFGPPKCMAPTILTDRPNIKLDLLSTLTKRSMKIFQRGEGGGDTLLLGGTSPRKPIKKISVGGVKQDNYLSTRLTIHDCPILPNDYRYQTIENIVREYLEKLQIPFSKYSVFQNLQSQNYSIVFPENFPLACSRCSSSSSFQLSQKNGFSVRCIVNTCTNLTLTSLNAPLYLPPNVATHLWGVPAETVVYGLDTKGSLDEWDYDVKSPTQNNNPSSGLSSARDTPRRITFKDQKFSNTKNEYIIEYRSYKERFRGDLETYLSKKRTPHDNQQRKVYKAYNVKGSQTQRVTAASPTNTLFTQRKETLMTDDNSYNQSLEDLNFNVGKEEKMKREIQGFVAEYFLRQGEQEEQKRKSNNLKKEMGRERLYTRLERKKKTRADLSTFKSFTISQSEIENSLGDLALKSVFTASEKKK